MLNWLKNTSASSSLPKSIAKFETCVRNGSFVVPMSSHFTAYIYNSSSELLQPSFPDSIHSPCIYKFQHVEYIQPTFRKINHQNKWKGYSSIMHMEQPWSRISQNFKIKILHQYTWDWSTCLTFLWVSDSQFCNYNSSSIYIEK